MKQISASLLNWGVTLAFTFPSITSSARAETKIVHEVEGKEASLALLKFQVEHHSGRFCAAKRAKLVLQEDDPVSASVVTKNKRDIPEASVLEVGRSLSGNENVTVFYCEGSGDDLVATGTSVSHVVFKKSSNWTASVMKSGKSIAAEDPSGARTMTDAEVVQTLAEASRQMNAMLPAAETVGLSWRIRRPNETAPTSTSTEAAPVMQLPAHFSVVDRLATSGYSKRLAQMSVRLSPDWCQTTSPLPRASTAT
jgi:hypothetical protein